jgi:hypothetical protein
MAERVFLDVERAIAEMLSAIEQELPKGALEGARIVAEEAAANHPYTNRTGRLQSRTQAGRVRGSALRGLIRAEVLGDTRYGGFVEHGTSRNRPYPYLGPAWVRRQDDFARAVDAALERAAVRAWGSA